MSNWIVPSYIFSLSLKHCNSVDDGDDDDGVIEVIKEGRSGAIRFLGRDCHSTRYPGCWVISLQRSP